MFTIGQFIQAKTEMRSEDDESQVGKPGECSVGGKCRTGVLCDLHSHAQMVGYMQRSRS